MELSNNFNFFPELLIEFLLLSCILKAAISKVFRLKVSRMIGAGKTIYNFIGSYQIVISFRTFLLSLMYYNYQIK